MKKKTFDTQNISISSKYTKPGINNQERINLERESLQVAKNIWYDQNPDLKGLTYPFTTEGYNTMYI